MKMYCKICDKDIKVKNKLGFANHVRGHHISIKEYYERYPEIYPTPEGIYGIDYVTCPICKNNRSFQSLTQHIINKHNMSTEEFLLKYPDSILFTKKYSKMRSEFCTKGLTERWKDPEWISKWQSYLKNELPKINRGKKNKVHSLTIKKTLKRLWNNPEYREFQSNLMKERHKSGEIERSILKGFRKNWIKHESPKGVITLKSTWELNLALALEQFNIEYDYEVKFDYYDTNSSRYRKYYADFYLPEYNLVIEVKAMWAIKDQSNIDKMKAVLNENKRFIFFTENELHYLNDKDSFTRLIKGN